MQVSINAQKALLRKEALKIRSSVHEKEALSKKIAERLFSLDEFKNCSSVFAYYSYPQEVSTKLIIEKAFLDEKKLALPRCEGEHEMSFYYVKNLFELESGKFGGILEPKESAEKAVPDEKTLFIVPALAFGKNGSRLGHGKGYYDRFLSASKGETVGLCFGSLLFEALPEDGFDRRVSFVITENETIRTALSVPQK